VGGTPFHAPEPLGARDELARPAGGAGPCGPGWKLEAVSTDNASEFRSKEFERALRAVKACHVFIRAGKPQSNGYVEHVHKTVLDECWKPPSSAISSPKYTDLHSDLDRLVRLLTPTVPIAGDTPKDISQRRSSAR
jgi:transposase InsO family protein